MADHFYKSFEDKHRGSREGIKGRLQIYLPFIQPLLKIHTKPLAIDLGCGRGEWLEVLKDCGFKGKGIDIDSDMLSECQNLGLSIKNLDALSAIAELKDESQSIISAFHLVEHLNFEDVKTLVAQSIRVLKPGGLLILETPNPENITVGANSFYLDPTHQRPIPPQLLLFTAEFYGFYRAKIVRMQEPSHLIGDGPVMLGDVLSGVSPDYAVIAQKAAENKVLKAFTSVFDKQYGLTVHDLTKRFDSNFIDSHSIADELPNITTSLQNNAIELKGELRSILEQHNFLMEEISISKAENEIAKSNIKAISHELDNAQKKASLDEQELEKVQNHSQWLQNEWNAEKELNQELLAQLSKAQLEKVQQDELIRLRTTELELARTNLAEEKTRVEQLQKDWAHSRERVEALLNDLSNAELDKVRRDGVIQLRTSELESTRIALLEEKTKTEQLQQDWANSRERVEALLNDLSNAELDKVRRDGVIQLRTSELESTRIALLEEKTKTEQLQQDWANSRERVEALLNDLSNAELDKLRLGEVVELRTAELDSTQTALLEEKARSEWLKNEWDESQKQRQESSMSLQCSISDREKLMRMIEEVHQSFSWKITWPIRKIFAMFRYLVKKPNTSLKHSPNVLESIAYKALNKLANTVDTRPNIKYNLIQKLKSHPKTNFWLRRFIIKSGISVSLPSDKFANNSENKNTNSAEQSKAEYDELDVNFMSLPPDAKEIYLKICKFKKNNPEVES
jgi:SAM-dependent methyltransferase